MTESSIISWEENKNLTKKKVKKKGVSKLIEQDSFFNFFKRVQMTNQQAGKLTMKQENELEERMDYHLEIANEFKN